MTERHTSICFFTTGNPLVLKLVDIALEEHVEIKGVIVAPWTGQDFIDDISRKKLHYETIQYRLGHSYPEESIAAIQQVLADWQVSKAFVVQFHELPPTWIHTVPQTINYHPAPFPTYQGARPIQMQLMHREQSTCVSWHTVSTNKAHEELVDQSEKVPIYETDTAMDVYQRLCPAAEISFRTLLSTPTTHVKEVSADRPADSRASREAAAMARHITPAMQSVHEIQRRIRAFHHLWFETQVLVGGWPVIVDSVTPLNHSAAPGEVLDYQEHTLTVGAVDAAIQLHLRFEPDIHAILASFFVRTFPNLSAEERLLDYRSRIEEYLQELMKKKGNLL